jgi:hypothetical protein
MGSAQQHDYDEQNALVNNWRRSGLSKSEWCERHSITGYDLRQWIAKDKSNIVQENVHTEWVSVKQENQVETLPSIKMIEIKIGAFSVRIGEEFSRSALSAVCQELSRL